MSKVTFELRADAQDFSGGSVALSNGDTYNVGEALDKGGGKITLDPGLHITEKTSAEKAEEERRRASADARLVDVLDSYPALKRTTSDATPTPTTGEKES
jgi:hypothetical protein